ncbi:DUF4142 domain-containing protein [Acidovorax sp. DW039]|uniref:DUF4142 domain-containing protein n=1 Tax=Acidovorax sp. DW039 TaxID=3095606 RepID=UPI00308E57D3|nr:DUF4142 domain-containing protein [Acidovorax sp. DW039]
MKLKTCFRFLALAAVSAACVHALAQPREGKGASMDQRFVTEAAQGGQAEIASSQLALQKAQRKEVKDFATQMIEDHTRTGQELATLARSKGMEAPTEPSRQQAETIRKLGAMKDAEFERRYVQEMGVKAHKQTVALFEKAAANAQDKDIKAFAAEKLSTLRHHLEMAQKLDSSKR